MRLKHVSARWLKSEIKKVLARYLDPSAYRFFFFFFGSRVNGDNFEWVDIDLGVSGPQAVSAKTRLTIQEELDRLPILYKIDLVDFFSVTDRFKKRLLNTLSQVNSADNFCFFW